MARHASYWWCLVLVCLAFSTTGAQGRTAVEGDDGDDRVVHLRHPHHEPLRAPPAYGGATVRDCRYTARLVPYRELSLSKTSGLHRSFAPSSSSRSPSRRPSSKSWPLHGDGEGSYCSTPGRSARLICSPSPPSRPTPAKCRALGGGIPGAIAGTIQVIALMWLRTISNYQVGGLPPSCCPHRPHLARILTEADVGTYHPLAVPLWHLDATSRLGALQAGE